MRPGLSVKGRRLGKPHPSLGYARSMTAFDALLDLPPRLHRNAVRDLAWTLLSPPLLGQTPKPQRHPLQASLWSSQPGLLADWLLRLDGDDSALLRWLQAHPAHRLGLYYERLWQFALHAAPDVEVLAANLPIRQGGHTLGELDLILRDEQGLHHLELAVKFYLGLSDADGRDATHWLGPGSRDRLDLKLAHLSQHQLPLSSRREARSLLNALKLQEPQAALWLGGYLFYPWPVACAAPAGASRQHLRGHWLRRSDWASFAASRPTATWQPLPRLSWLAAARVDEANRWPPARLQRWLDELPAHANAQLLVRLEERDGNWQEAERAFLVDDRWPLQASDDTGPLPAKV